MPFIRYPVMSLVAGAVLLLVGLLMSRKVGRQVDAEYMNGALFRPWAQIEAYMFVHPLLMGFLFAGAFLLLRPNITGSHLADGTLFGLVLFAAGALPIYVLAYAAFVMPTNVFVVWCLHTLTQYLLAGLALGLLRWAW